VPFQPLPTAARGIAALALGTVVALAAAPVAHAATPTPAELGAGWLTTQLVGGDHLQTTYGGTAYDDAGLTADVVLALDAAGVGQSSASAATAWLAGQVTSYTGDGTGESYAGALAKLSLVAEAQGLDPHAFGGSAPVNDLLARLLAQKAGTGRFSDVSAYGDYSNTITQSFAVLALDRDAGAPADAVDFLAAAQCPDGGFPLQFDQPTCSSDLDATAFSVQALLATGRSVTAALDYLEAQQRSNGGFGGTGPTSETNSNSTGLAVAALQAGGRTAPAAEGAAYLTALQVGCSGAAGSRSAIAYDATGYDATTAPRATAQAVPALAGVSLADVAAAGATAGFPTLECAAAPVATPGTPTDDSTTGGSTTGGSTTGGPGTGAGAGAGTGGASDVPLGLPATGDPVRQTAVLGGALLLGGVAVLAATRRRRETAAA